MLSDLYQLEMFFGPAEAVQMLEYLSQKYGPEKLRDALASGDLCCRSSCKGQILVWLSEQGRAKAL